MKIVHHYVTSVLWSIIVLWWIIFNHNSYGDYIDSQPINIWIRIVNSYSGWINFSTWQNIVLSWVNQWINTPLISIDVSATTWSEFTLDWDINIVNFSWVGMYTLPVWTQLDIWDGPKVIHSYFLKDHIEPYQWNDLEIYLDETSPSLPTIIWPLQNTIVNWSVWLSWNNSTDIWIWFSHYIVHMSLDPGFLGETTVVSSSNSLNFGSGTLPIGTLFWYVEAVDYLWNSVATVPSFFHNQTSSDVSWAGGGGSSWWDGWGSGTWDQWWNNSSWAISTWSNWWSWDTIIPPIDTNEWTWNINNWSGDIYSGNIITDLVNNYNNLNTWDQWLIILPPQNNTGSIIDTTPPDDKIYNNLIINYYHKLKPLWYTLNYVSWLLFPFYYLIRIIEYLIYRLRKRLSKHE